MAWRLAQFLRNNVASLFEDSLLSTRAAGQNAQENRQPIESLGMNISAHVQP
jgi:hypothetical protein